MPRSSTRLALRATVLLAVASAACSDSSSGGDLCMLPPFDGGVTCMTSDDCGRGAACVGGKCAPIAACGPGCGACSLERVCTSGSCTPPPGKLCGPCGDACTMAGGTCRDEGCATPCDDNTVFCPRGFYCDIAQNATQGVCIPTLTTGCAGCAADSDCPSGEVCNENNRRCITAPTGEDARLELDSLDFLYDDGMGHQQVSRNLVSQVGFYSRHDPAFDPFTLDAGACGSERSTFDLNAPYPVGPGKDAGDPIVLTLPSRMVDLTRETDPNPIVGVSYTPTDLMVTDWVPGAATWSVPGSSAVAAVTLMGTIAPDYTTTPDILGAAPVPASATSGVTLVLDSPTPAGLATVLEVEWNEGSGGAVTALVRIACRAPDGGTSVTIPGAQLANAPRGVALGLLVSRVSVKEWSGMGVARGRMVLAAQKTGAVVIQ